MLKIPFVGCDVLASAICLDKAIFNQLMAFNNIKKPKFSIVDFDHDSKNEISAKIITTQKNFAFPVFVKPSRAGSSIGIRKVKQKTNLEKAIKYASKFDKKVIIEEAVKNCQEIEIAVMGNKNNVKASLPGRIIPGNEFYDYNDKYKNDNAKFEIPARLSPRKTKEIQEIATKAYKIVNCQGLARVDFLLDDKLNIYLNEINTMSGFTPISM